MSVELTSPKADALARALAAATGEDLETAVERAIEERLARVPRGHATALPAELDAIFDRLSRMPALDDRSPDDIVGYGADGLPT